ncbi:exostosin [Dunaliella salina]|uniref:Exostosin n=1 Tax=Dunaliella salina TaxID=3046 RepID=A0ABQ7G0K1_DUNSA|nr:exostosin [Dunaliella salina]|eukprot:KAF5828127.1 exostosin [Dunaliella salina]
MPQFLREHKLRKPVEVVITRTNDVTNRWRRQGHIATQAVFNMDDDTTVDTDTLEFGFSIWKKHPDQVIGFFDRVIFLDTTTGQYVYGYDAGVVAPEKYGIVIGKAWIASVELLRLAENDQDPLLMRMREFLHDPQREQKGCDDIAWNMFLHLRGAKPPIGLAGVRMDDIITWDGQKTTGYSAVSEADPDAWTRYRTHCIAGLLRVCGLQKPHLPPSPVQQYLVPAAAQPQTFGTWEQGGGL